MSVRKRGFRRLVVGGVEYRWKFPRRLTDQEEEQPGVWAVVQSADPQGSQLLIVFPNRHHVSGPHAEKGKPALPSKIAAGIHAALKAGWDKALTGFVWETAKPQRPPRPF